MKRSRRILAIAALLLTPSLGLGAWYGVISKASGKGNELSRILEDYGYSPLKLPSRLYGPGKFISVKPEADGSLNLRLTCGIAEEDLAPRWVQSATLNTRSISNVGSTFEATVEGLKAAMARATGDRARGVNVFLTDMRILVMPHDRILAVQEEYLKGHCESAVIKDMRDGFLVCQSEEVLQADVVFRIELKSKVGSLASLKVAAQAAGSADIDLKASKLNEVRGEDLFLGLKLGLGSCLEFDKPDVQTKVSSL